MTTIKERGILGSVEAMLLRNQAFDKENQLNKIFQKKKNKKLKKVVDKRKKL